jgi:hypothetical protein
MSQHDLDIANADFPTTRADITAALVALASKQSGLTEPADTYAHMWWMDLASYELKIRNAADDAWVVVGVVNQSTGKFELVDDSVTPAVVAPGTYVMSITGNAATVGGEAPSAFADAGANCYHNSGFVDFGGIDPQFFNITKLLPTPYVLAGLQSFTGSNVIRMYGVYLRNNP